MKRFRASGFELIHGAGMKQTRENITSGRTLRQREDSGRAILSCRDADTRTDTAGCGGTISPKPLTAAVSGKDGCGGRIRTCDLRLMRPASFHCSTHAMRETIDGRPRETRQVDQITIVVEDGRAEGWLGGGRLLRRGNVRIAWPHAANGLDYREDRHFEASGRTSRQDAKKVAADTSPAVPLSMSRASSILGFRAPDRTRVSVLGDLPIRTAKAETFSPLFAKYAVKAVMSASLPNRQTAVNAEFAYLALAEICLIGKVK